MFWTITKYIHLHKLQIPAAGEAQFQFSLSLSLSLATTRLAKQVNATLTIERKQPIRAGSDSANRARESEVPAARLDEEDKSCARDERIGAVHQEARQCEPRQRGSPGERPDRRASEPGVNGTKGLRDAG